MTLEDLIKVRDSLKECNPSVEDFCWGPTYEFAQKRRDKAMFILTKEIRRIKNDTVA
jgi:hypothetical protein